MSRHRNMKYIAEDAIESMDYEGDYDDYYNTMDPDVFDQKVDQIYETLGDHLDYNKVEKALKDSNGDVELAIDIILNPPITSIVKKNKTQKKKKKKKKKQHVAPEPALPEPILSNPHSVNGTIPFPGLGSTPALSKQESNISNLSRKSSTSKKSRKGSVHFEKVKRKMSSNNAKVSRKDSRKYAELSNAKIYGNELYPEIKYKINPKEIEEKKNRVSIVIAGHVDSGKSTLLGQIMVLMNKVDKTILRKLEKYSEQEKSKGVKYAWIFDEREDEREKGITVDVNEKYVAIGNKIVTFLDTPGHRDLVPKMISGASQSQFAMLIVDGEKGQFLNGFDPSGQTREHSYLLNSMGPKKLFIIVNKMDMTNWDEESFNYVKNEMQSFFRNENLNNFKEIQFVPVSALEGENISTLVGDKAAWWKGGCLFDYLQDLSSDVEELVTKPFRMNIQAAYESKEHGKKGYLISGRIDGGMVKKSDKLVIKPIDLTIQVKDLYVGEDKYDHAIAGDIVDMIVSIKKDKDWLNIRSGLTVSSKKYTVPVTDKFLAEVNIYDIDTPILKGNRVNFYFGTQVEGGLIKKLKEIRDKKTGVLLKKNPRFLVSKCRAIVEIHLERPICVELDKNFDGMGLFQFREKGKTLGDGKIQMIL